MAQNVIACDREQSFLLPPDVRDWLPEDHLPLSGCARAGGGSKKELAVERAANAQYEAYRRRGVMKDDRRFGRPPNPRQPPTPATGISSR